MFKLRSMMEDVAEKLFGRFLPEVEAQASNCPTYHFNGCCGPQFSMASVNIIWCDGTQSPDCTGICPI